MDTNTGQSSPNNDEKPASGGTPGELKARWRKTLIDKRQALLRIPSGHVTSYGEIAAAIGNPKAVRAVGGANGRNPVAIVLPCHRVIGANGSLTGFGGGIAVKQWLLQHERSAIADS